MINNDTPIIELTLPPIGLKIFSGREPLPDAVEGFNGVSFCQAVSEATAGRKIMMTPFSINICKWSPVVLGFKKAEDAFEKTITHALPVGTTGVYLAPIDMIDPAVTPDIVMIRTTPENHRAIIGVLGWEAFIDDSGLGQDVTALSTFRGNPPRGLSGWLIRNVNTWLDRLNRFDGWHKLTTIVFKSRMITRIFDRFIATFMANMSMCRNSLAVPLVMGKANISYFCTGGISWGKNASLNMTAGFPFSIYQQLAPNIDYPRISKAGKPAEDRQSRN